MTSAPLSTPRVRPVTALETRRRSLRLSQRDGARAVGVSRQHWSACERGLVPSPHVQGAIAAVLGVATSDLWPEEDGGDQ